MALENTTPERFIRFAEMEFQPSTTETISNYRQRIVHASPVEDVELQRVPTSYSRGSWGSQVTLVEKVKTPKAKKTKKRPCQCCVSGPENSSLLQNR